MTANTPLSRQAAWREIARWHAEVGLDAAILDTPRNRYEETPQPPWRPFTPPARAPQASALTSAAAPSPSPPREEKQRQRRDDTPEALFPASPLAESASSLEELRAALDAFDGCDLKRAARSLVFADGNPAASVMLIGEAPGAEEDKQGLPFVGRSGKLLDRMLAAIGLDRNSVYITNILPWRPHGNRAPSTEEIALLLPFVERHILLAAPEVILLVGGIAAKSLLGVPTGIMRLRGKWATLRLGEREFPALPTFHPAYLLRRPQDKALAWRDFLALKHRLAELSAAKE